MREIRFDDDGLVPCVMQDWGTGEVLTLAYMNEEELRRTGETSGNTMTLRQLRFDCDADAIVALVQPAGPACHTGERSCFHRDLDTGEAPDPAVHEALAALERTIAARAAERPDGSYTAELLADAPRIGDKVREEADEVARAADGESDERIAEEAADVLYHLEVLLRSREIPLAAALEVLN